MSLITDLASRAGSAAQSLWEASGQLVQPSLRIGVTGLARSGKTVFTTALVHHLTKGTVLPAFRASADGRIRRAQLAHQPDDDVPRFPYEEHVEALTRGRRWPQSTSRISELRIDIDYERKAGWRPGPATLALDIVDYPGEWLLDLALLEATYEEWSQQTIEGEPPPRPGCARRPVARGAAEFWTRRPGRRSRRWAGERCLQGLSCGAAGRSRGRRNDAAGAVPHARRPRRVAGADLRAARPFKPGEPIVPNSFAALMQRRFEAYKTHVVQPFFRDHFQRIDRQIVLVDVLAAIDAGPVALAELEEALDRVLMAFRTGRNTLLSRLFSPRADRVLFAATKADHIHHTDHDRLDALLRLLVNRAARRTEAAGARVGTVALASVRATRETSVREGREVLKAVAGTPEAGEIVGDEVFDGETEAAVFPGELPEHPEAVFQGAVPPGSLRFPRFRPPKLSVDAAGRTAKLPHIRLDRALEFLIGDKLA